MACWEGRFFPDVTVALTHEKVRITHQEGLLKQSQSWGDSFVVKSTSLLQRVGVPLLAPTLGGSRSAVNPSTRRPSAPLLTSAVTHAYVYIPHTDTHTPVQVE